MADSNIEQPTEFVNEKFGDWLESDLAQRLLLVFENLEDKQLLSALQETRKTGRPGHPIPVMWRIVLAQHVLNLDSFSALIRALDDNPLLANLCGITNRSDISTKMSISRFVHKLVDHSHLIEQCQVKITNELAQALPRFGETVAIDSSNISAFSNGSKPQPSDPDAGWSAKGGRNGEPEWWFGYKIHLMADAIPELPLVLRVTPANRHDSKEIIPLLRKARFQLKGFAPRTVLADAGYDAKHVYKSIVEEFEAIPIIKMNMRGKKPDDIYDELTDYIGRPYAEGCGIPLSFRHFDETTGELVYGCPELDGLTKCPLLEKCGREPQRQIVRLSIDEDYRRYCQIPRTTEGWDNLYRLRGSVERVFSRLKAFRRLDNVTLRGLEKVILHCQLSVMVMQAMALGKVRQEALSEVRNNVRLVA